MLSQVVEVPTMMPNANDHRRSADQRCRKRINEDDETYLKLINVHATGGFRTLRLEKDYSN